MKELSARAASLLLAALFILFYFPLLSGEAYLWEDVIEQHYPNIVFTMNSIGDGALPQWNPFVFGGMPFMADMQTTLFYPPAWVLFAFQTFTEPGGTVFIIYILLHVLLFGIGMMLLSRNFGVSGWTSLLIGVGSTFSGFVSTHVIHINFLFVVSWFPFAFLFLKKAFDSWNMRNLGIATLFGGISILGGYAQYTLFCSYLLFIYAAYSCISSIKIDKMQPVSTIAKYALFFGIFAIFSYGLALVQLLPSLELAAESVRTKMTWERSIEGSLDLNGLLTLFVPKFFGYITGSGAATPYWGGKGFHLFWETACFVGIMPLLIVIVMFKENKKKPLFVFFISLSILALLLMLGSNGPLYWLVFNFLPGFGSFRHPGRFAFVFLVALVMAAGIAFDSLIVNGKNETEEEKKRKFKEASISAAIISFIVLFAVLSLMPDSKESAVNSKNGALFAFFSIILFLAVVWTALKKNGAFPASVMAVAILFIELYLFGSSFGIGKNKGKDIFAPNPQIEVLRKESEKTPFRFQGRIFEGEGKGVRLFPHLNLGSVYRIGTVEGYNQLHLSRLSRFVHEVEPKKGMDLMNVRFRARTDGRGFYEAMKGTYRERFQLFRKVESVTDSAQVIKLINSDRYNSLVNSVVEEPLTLVYDTSFVSNSDNIVIIANKPERIELDISVSSNALLVAAEPWFPAWRAELDGKNVPILHADFLFRGVEIPQGQHRLVFKYESDAFNKGVKLSAAALLFLLLMTGFGSRVKTAIWKQ